MAKKPTSKKPSVKKKSADSTVKKRAKTTQSKSRTRTNYTNTLRQLGSRRKAFLARRPHRSFRLTKRRDYKRSLALPGYFSFTHQVFAHLKAYKWTFLGLLLTMSLFSGLLVGIASQDKFNLFSELLRDAGNEVFSGGWGEIGKATLILTGGIIGGFSSELSEVGQVFAMFIAVFTWLTAVWLIRTQLAGHKPRLRDGLYNAGAPIFPTILITIILMLQLIPAILGIGLYNVADATGFLQAGLISMLAALAAGLAVLITLYLLTSTMIALVVVTLPGVYPMKAIKIAGDLVVGRRLRILLRLIWMTAVLAVLWAVIVIPIVIFSSWLQTTFEQTAWLPIVPITLLITSTASVIFSSSYVYMLYRKVVDDDSPPA